MQLRQNAVATKCKIDKIQNVAANKNITWFTKANHKSYFLLHSVLFAFSRLCILVIFYYLDLHFVKFAFYHIYILSHFQFGTFAFCHNCILSLLYFVTFAFCHNCVLSHLRFVAFVFCVSCIPSFLHFVALAFWHCILCNLHFVLIAFHRDKPIPNETDSTNRQTLGVITQGPAFTLYTRLLGLLASMLAGGFNWVSAS